MSETAFLLHRTRATIPDEGPSPFDLPPVQWQDGDHRSFLVRDQEVDPYTGQPRFIRWVRAPNPDPWPVRLMRPVAFADLILDPSTFLAAVSQTLDESLGGAVSGAMQETEPVTIFRAAGKTGRPYRMGTLAPRDAIATHVDFSGSVFDLVGRYDFPRHGDVVEAGDITVGDAYPTVERGVTFGDLDAFRAASRTATNTLNGSYVPTRLALALPRVPALFHLDHGLVLASAAVAEALNQSRNPGAICPWPPIPVALKPV